MSKRTYATGRRAPTMQAQARANIPPRQPRHTTPRHAAKRPPTRNRTPRRPTVRCRKRPVVVSQTRHDLAFLLIVLMFVLVMISPMLAGALVAFDKLMPILAMVLGHYFGQK